MSSITTPAPATSLPAQLRARLLPRAESAPWVLPAQIGVVLLAAVTYLWNLTVSGFANTYYAMAAQAASQSWSAWFWGSLDSANFITVDKPPLATMLMGLSVRVFGLSSASILLPEALCGIATVVLLYAVVRRYFGPAAATLAAVIAALTPAAVLMFRYDNPDALLTLLLVGAAAALLRALENGRLRWVIVSAVLVGLAFNTKFLQAYLVLPAFVLVYLVAAQGSLRRRVAHLIVAALSVLVASGWWVAAVQLTPATLRPYIGGSTNDSALQLLLGYDGLQRILGIFGIDGSGPGGGQQFGANFGGVPDLFRLFNSQFGGEIAWLLPAALVGLVVGLIARWHAPRTDLRRAVYLLAGGWLIVHVAVFSFMSGIVHSYYAVAMAPAIGVLAGAGAVELWTMRARGSRDGVIAGTTLGATVAGTALLAAVLLARSPEFLPWLAPIVVIGGAVAGVCLALPNVSGRLAGATAGLALAAVLAGPGAYASVTVNTAYAGGDPQPGPASATTDRGPGVGFGPGGQGFPIGGPDGAGFAGGPGLGGPEQVSSQLVSYLETNQGSATWIVAVRSSQEGAAIQLATGQSVMVIGGFNGGDNALSIDQLRAYVASGQLRYVLVGGQGGPGGGPGGQAGGSSAVFAWITQHGSVVTQFGTLYDLSSALTD